MKPLVRLVVPVLVEQLLALSVGFVDKWLAGNLFAGAEPLAAVGLVAYCLAFLPVLFALPTAAVTALVARHVGAGEPAAARRALAQCGLVAIAPTLVMAILSVVWGSRIVAALGLPPESSLLAERYLAIVLPAQVNAEFREPHIVYRDYCDIGIAVGGGKGLVVPVIRNAELLSFAQIEQTIGEFARRASENKLKLEELQGGTFTISNGGVYGSMLSTPIINPPQSGILGLHSIQDRPMAVNGQVVIRPMMYLALTYDHRLVDGREAVTFLKRIKDTIEDPSRLMLEV